MTRLACVLVALLSAAGAAAQVQIEEVLAALAENGRVTRSSFTDERDLWEMVPGAWFGNLPPTAGTNPRWQVPVFQAEAEHIIGILKPILDTDRSFVETSPGHISMNHHDEAWEFFTFERKIRSGTDVIPFAGSVGIVLSAKRVAVSVRHADEESIAWALDLPRKTPDEIIQFVKDDENRWGLHPLRWSLLRLPPGPEITTELVATEDAVHPLRYRVHSLTGWTYWIDALSGELLDASGPLICSGFGDTSSGWLRQEERRRMLLHPSPGESKRLPAAIPSPATDDQPEPFSTPGG
jgi:hypothetical protein